MKTIRKPIALVLLAALAACGGGNGSTLGGSPAMPAARHAVRPNSANTLTNIVGVGDSLTAGYQSGGILGALTVPNPLLPGTKIPPGQESGFWADIFEQATGFSPAAMYNPAVSPLPLIAGPGLDNQIVSSETTIIGVSKSGNSCEADGGFDQAAFSLSNLKRVRMNAGTGKVRDLGVPGITLHEAAHMVQPLTPTCNALPGTAGLLSSVTNGESGLFYPILGDFAFLRPNMTMVASAQSLHPSLVTVWLGANDVLKFMGSGGLFKGGDMTAAQTQSDLQPIVRSFQNQNAQVVVANLPDVLLAPYFMNIEIPAKAHDCKINQYFYCLLVQFGTPPDLAAKVTKDIGAAYHLEPPGGKCVRTTVTSPCGYVTLPGALAVVSALLSGGKVPNLDPAGPGSGLGNHYLTPAFAGAIQTVNDNINTGIAQTASATGIPMVDIKSAFQGIASGNPKNPYFQLAQVNPGVCCYEVFLGGLVSFDGIHPSNTGYALISYLFIQAINQSYGTSIKETPIKAIYAGKPPYLFQDPYAPQLRHDLEVVRSGKTAALHYEVPRNF